jgi:2-succinyl-6-hydroxy-2,4-cyclohexadiene-1-carboxylate synthase
MLYALHGFTETDESWAETLASDIPGLRCPLLPGHGGKPCPGSFGWSRMVEDLAAVLPGEPVDLLGYSMGGRIALNLALTHPRRIRRLILVSCHPGIRDPAEPFPAAVAEAVRARRLNQDPIGLAACLRALGGGAMDPVWSRLGELRMPVLLISGAGDVRYMRLMDEMAASIPDRRREIVLRSGHAVHRERPQVVAQMVGAFLV